MPEEYGHDDSDTPEEHDGMGPEADNRPDIAAVVEYGEKFEACQVTACKVLAAKKLIELAGGYKEAVILTDAVWFADIDNADEAAGGASRADEDDAEPNLKAWVAKVRRVMAAEKLLQVASGYTEAFTLLTAIVLALHGEEGYQQMLIVRDAAAGYHERVAAALKQKEGR